MKKYIFSILTVMIVLALTVAVFSQEEAPEGTRGQSRGAGAGARGGRGGVTTQRQLLAIEGIEQLLMILKGNQLQVEHNAEMAELQAIADKAVEEGAKETAKLLQEMIAQREEIFQRTIASLGITFGGAGGARGGAGAMTSSIGAEAVDHPDGALLESVESGRATRFGLEEGDIVKSINGQKVTDAESFEELMNGVERGAAVSIEIIRDGEEMTVGREAMGERGGRGGRGGGTEGAPTTGRGQNIT